ncbi:hypothetical protein B0H15DRAFT_820978 [Mycena belliarum]|uniref:Uncharacterized protein n=1 Tax=Mycena belliarum TaxID=1033014 RepID=A0AAD6UBW9_9AGAR|nr:hypothetical protein B0H15DRAFT_820978 [Mycena belliae]
MASATSSRRPPALPAAFARPAASAGKPFERAVTHWPTTQARLARPPRSNLARSTRHRALSVVRSDRDVSATSTQVRCSSGWDSTQKASMPGIKVKGSNRRRTSPELLPRVPAMPLTPSVKRHTSTSAPSPRCRPLAPRHTPLVVPLRHNSFFISSFILPHSIIP